MGEIHLDLFGDYDTVIRPTFNGAVQVEAREERLTGDAGAILAQVALRDLQGHTSPGRAQGSKEIARGQLAYSNSV